MDSDFLSNIELYFTEPVNIRYEELVILGEEHSHITRVMRHNINDELHVTDGEGKIYKCNISNISKESVTAKIQSVINYDNPFSNYFFCIPKLKSADRFEFALEKCVELGITNFVIFDAERSISKSSKLDRWNKILLAAMKQSLRSYLPKLELIKSLEQIMKLEGNKIVFEQNAQYTFKEFIPGKSNKNYFIFGPEGGLSENELNLFTSECIYSLTNNRLRAETAVVTVGALLNSKII